MKFVASVSSGSVVASDSKEVFMNIMASSSHSWFPKTVVFHSVSGKFSFSLKPFGSKVFSFEIQKSSLWRSKFRIWSLVKFFFVISSITISRKSRLKLWSFWLKCWSMDIESGRVTSFLCLLVRLFIPWASTFPTYCFRLHFKQKPR